MGISVLATFCGTVAGIAAFIGVFVVDIALAYLGLVFLRNGGGGFNFVWLGVLPCLVAAVVASLCSGPAFMSRLPVVAVGTGGGVLATWAVFSLLAGMQGLNPLIFAGPFCAATVAASLSTWVRSRDTSGRA